MDIKKDNTRNQVFKPTPETNQSHFCESNAGHLSVQTTSPFKMKMRDSEFVADQKMRSKNDRSTNAMYKKLPNEACSSATSKLLINQIIRDNNLDGERLNVKEINTENNLRTIGNKSNYSPNLTINHIQFKRSAPTFNCKSSSLQLGLCSREESIASAANPGDSSEKHTPIANPNNSNTSHQKICAEKTTYCRPTLNFNHEFINSTLEKNARLKYLVKKLIISIKKEKETEAWNNYINELKNKHELYNRESHSPMQCNGRYFEYIDDYYTESEVNGSKTRNELLHDFYLACDDVPPSFRYDIQVQDHPVYCDYQSTCYPISSQGHYKMLNNERGNNPFAKEWQNRSAGRSCNMTGHTIIVDRENKRKIQDVIKTSPPLRKYTTERKRLERASSKICDGCQTNKNFATQTSSEQLSGNITTDLQEKDSKNMNNTFEVQYERVSQNVDRLKRRFQKSVKMNEHGILASIENKLDTLITSLNSFITEVKSRNNINQNYDCRSVSLNSHKLSYKNMNISRSDTFGLVKAERLVCDLLTQNVAKPIPYKGLDKKEHNASRGTNIDKILSEEIGNSMKVKEDIENMLSGNALHSCAVQLSLDIPTKERSTEVTDSLSKAILLHDTSVGNVAKDTLHSNGKTTIAINTDPLSLLALLRISTDTVKQFLSYMPNIPCYSYLSMLQSPQIRMQSDFVCNICGAAFRRPSQLSDHIQGHDLGKSRDCCVCRHVLDMQNQRPPGLFRCRYCGQRFTRAYCCELHQESCARRLGLKYDVRPSLMLLR